MNPTTELLKWYRRYGRDFPWRVKGGAHENAYAVWISEIMLQQTTTQTVMSYFTRWMERFPTIESVAAADLQDVLLMWQGLGYYTRAKKIHECARVLVRDFNGRIPNKRDVLLKLPGIGPYTASSICCFAFNQPETVVDGNVIRVIARFYGLTHAVGKDEIYALAEKLTDPKYGADYASAIMDLGATVCTPTNATCGLCPWQGACVAFHKGLVDQIPVIQKPAKKERTGTVYLIRDDQGRYLIRRRSGRGLLSGLYEFPWYYSDEAQPAGTWESMPGTVTHTFTHFRLTLVLKRGVPASPEEGFFCAPADFEKYPFSTLMSKVIKKI